MKWIKEFETIKEEWKNSNTLVKILLVLGLFLTISSIASLSDKVFKWKGFILDGVSFYREWIRGPIMDLLSLINVDISENLKDITIIFLILASSHVRYLFYYSLQLDKVNEKSARRLILSLAIIMIPAYTVFIYHFTTVEDIGTLTIWLISIFAFNLVVTTITILNDKKDLIVLYMPMAISIVLVLLLGGINSGLTR